MGTDLIVFVLEKDGKAACFYEIGRDYDLYALMGYVKGSSYQEPYHRSRGLPKGVFMPNLGRLYRQSNGDHNASWMTADEFECVKRKYEWMYSSDDDESPYVWPYNHILDLATQTGGTLVFWFNS